MQTPKTFSLEIEKVAKDKGINHMDAVIWYCQKNDLEPDSVGRLITKGLKEKIEANARELNFLERTGRAFRSHQANRPKGRARIRADLHKARSS